MGKEWNPMTGDDIQADESEESENSEPGKSPCTSLISRGSYPSFPPFLIESTFPCIKNFSLT